MDQSIQGVIAVSDLAEKLAKLSYQKQAALLLAGVRKHSNNGRAYSPARQAYVGHALRLIADHGGNMTLPQIAAASDGRLRTERLLVGQRQWSLGRLLSLSR